MAVRQGYGKIAGTDALVFAYDTGDTRNSYIGEPTTNLALFNIASSGFGTDTPSNLTQTSNDTEFTYKGRPSRKMVIGEGYWNCYIFSYNSSVSSTVFTVSFKVKAADGSNPSTFIGGGYIYGTAGSFFPPPSFTAIDDGWYICYIRYSGTAMTLTSLTGVNGSGGPKTFYITDYQAEAKDHFTPFTPGNTTRSSTQGLLDLPGNSTIDLANVSFDSNAQMFFDGTNDNVTAANNSSINVTGAEITLEAIFKPDSFGVAEAIIHKDVQYTLAFYPNGGQGNITYADSSLWSYSSFGYHGVFLTGKYYHVVATKKNGKVNIYSNSELIVSQDFGGSITSTSNPLYIGSYENTYYSHGVLPVVKIYNRALTADEVRNNYNQYRTRFNI